MGDHQNSAGARHSNGDKTLFRYGRSGSGYVTAKGSPNTVAASWNETRCFRRFCLALAGSHSKFTTLSYPAAARRSNHSPEYPILAGAWPARDAPTRLCVAIPHAGSALPLTSNFQPPASSLYPFRLQLLPKKRNYSLTSIVPMW